MIVVTELRRAIPRNPRSGGRPGPEEPPHDHQLPHVVGRVVDRQEQLAQVRLIGAMWRDGDEINPSVSR